MMAWEFAQALAKAEGHGWTRFVAMQNHYNLVYREEEREMMPLCRAEGIGVIPWSPLARGFLTGTRSRGARDATVREQSDEFAHTMYYPESDYRIVDRVVEIARGRGVTPAQMALAWMLGRPGVTAPIVGTSKPSSWTELVAAEAIVLADDECRYLEELYTPHPVLGMN